MKRQIALVKAQGVGDGVIVSTMELEALIEIAEAAEILDTMLRGHPDTDWWPITRTGPLMNALAHLKRENEEGK